MLTEACDFHHYYNGKIGGIAVADDYLVAFEKNGTLDIRKIRRASCVLELVGMIVHEDSRYTGIAFIYPNQVPWLLVADNANGHGTVHIVDILAQRRVGRVGTFETHTQIRSIASSGKVIAAGWTGRPALPVYQIDLFQQSSEKLEWVRFRVVPYHPAFSHVTFAPDDSKLIVICDQGAYVTEIGVYDLHCTHILAHGFSIADSGILYRDGWLVNRPFGGIFTFMRSVEDNGIPATINETCFLTRRWGCMANCPGLGVFALDSATNNLRLLLETDVARMRGMAPIRLAWMCAVFRA